MDVRGPSYPFAIDPNTGQIAWSEGVDKIKENIRLILATRLGERPMERNFGTRVHQLVHEPNDAALAKLVASQVQEALLRQEPRIIVTSATVRQQDGLLCLDLKYIHSDRPIADSMVIPLG